MRELQQRVEAHVRALDLIPPRGEVTVLVSGGADSTCAWHVLRELGYRVSALHVNHGLRGAESEEDARFCRDRFAAEVVDGRGGITEDELRRIRYSFAADQLRATGHTASDQVETILYRLATSGRPTGIKARREDGVVRPLLPLWRDETEAYCAANELPFRRDASNDATVRGRIRDAILPLLRAIHPAADANILRALDERPPVPPAVVELIRSTAGSARLDLGGGVQLVREYDKAWLERGPAELDGPIEWGGWRIESRERGLKVRGWRPGDRLAGRGKKIQDVFVDAKVPRSEREAWPLVVRGDEVVAVPGIIEADAIKAVRIAGGDEPGASSEIHGRADMRGAAVAINEEGGPRGKHGFPRDSEPKAKRNAD